MAEAVPADAMIATARISFFMGSSSSSRVPEHVPQPLSQPLAARGRARRHAEPLAVVHDVDRPRPLGELEDETPDPRGRRPGGLAEDDRAAFLPHADAHAAVERYGELVAEAREERRHARPRTSR